MHLINIDNLHATAHAGKKMYFSTCFPQKEAFLSELVIYNKLFPIYNTIYNNYGKIKRFLA